MNNDSEQFVFWLKGFLEGASAEKGLNKIQVEKIKKKISKFEDSPRITFSPCTRPHADIWITTPQPYILPNTWIGPEIDLPKVEWNNGTEIITCKALNVNMD